MNASMKVYDRTRLSLLRMKLCRLEVITIMYYIYRIVVSKVKLKEKFLCLGRIVLQC
jgi:hypothetical protein